MSSHALLSASGAERWMHCPPSARLEEKLPESVSGYAEEGRLAHAVAELKLRKHFLEPMGTRTYNSRLKKLQEDSLYQPEMQEHTDAYLDYIKQLTMSYPAQPMITVEQRLDFSLVVPDGFGTADCVILGGDTLHVVDFKYGKGVPVSAAENPQMMLYALGAVLHYNMFYDIKAVRMSIFQPRLDSVSEWETTRDKLLDWGQGTVRPLAKLAHEGSGAFAAGDWCRFCRAKAQCRARADFQLSLEEYADRQAALLSDAEIGDALTRAQTLRSWASDLEEYALSALLAGSDIPGWKAVEGRSTRSFTDGDAAFAAVTAAGYDEALLYERKPITLTGVEKLLGKTTFDELLKGYVEKPKGKPTIAPENDKRQPYNMTRATDDFGTSA